MAKIQTTISLDEDVKKEAQELLPKLGLDLSTAINIFLKQTVRECAIPFTIKMLAPNSTTLAAMREAERIAGNPSEYEAFDSVDSLFDEVLANA